jgi:2,3-bisphosphoglycerate-dependent phosphoglycerate mutase
VPHPVYLLRHCAASGQDPGAALTERGHDEAAALVPRLRTLGITRIVSSPWRRAIASVSPFAASAGLSVGLDAGLVELRLADAPRPDWRTDLARAFADPGRVPPGGESPAAARTRALAAIGATEGDGPLLVVSHGALTTLALGFGFAEWAAMETPDLFRLDRGERMPIAPAFTLRPLRVDEGELLRDLQVRAADSAPTAFAWNRAEVEAVPAERFARHAAWWAECPAGSPGSSPSATAHAAASATAHAAASATAHAAASATAHAAASATAHAAASATAHAAASATGHAADRVLFVGAVGPHPIAMCTARMDGSTVRIGAMWVDAAHRRAGFGDALLQRALAWGRTRRAAVADLWVAEPSTAAAALYAKHGFVPTGTRGTLPHDATVGIVQLRRAPLGVLRGRVTTGFGDLSRRMRDVSGLLDAYARRTGMRLFPGSLNLRLDADYRVPRTAARLAAADYGGAVSAFLVPCRIGGRSAFLVRTDRNEAGTGAHPWALVEVVSDVPLRDTLALADGAAVDVELDT